jgi:hypothetical protein
VLAGDFLDLLRMGDAGRGQDLVADTVSRPEYQGLFAALRAFRQAAGHRVVYMVGNHDAAVWWNPGIQRSLRGAGLVDSFALSYSASFRSLPDQLVYCEHGNQFDPSSTIADYANPLDTPVDAHVVAELVRPIGSGARIGRGLDLREVSYVFPLAAHPGPAEWVAGRIFYRFFDQVLRWLLVLLAILVAAYAAYGALAVVRGRSSGGLLAVTAFGLLGWLLYDTLGLGSAQLAVAVTELVGVVAIIASSVPMWNQILRYARAAPSGTGGAERTSEAERS